MKKFLLIVCIALFSFTAAAQETGVISGKVTENEQGFSLPGATLKLNSGNKYAVSNQNGEFEFLNVPVGTFEIEISYIGYQKQTKTVTVESKKNVTVTFVLVPESNELSEVVVIGDRLRGQAKALNQQKTNKNITNVISSDQVGRFPDANIGDALKRVPGITMQNDQGEARNIIIRGIAPALNSVTLNGDRIPSAEGDNRNVQMDLIPSDMIATIEVNKTLTPDMDADAIGGSVNLITRASPNGERISATVAGGFAPIRDKGIYTAGLVYGNRYFKNKLGAVISGSYNNNNYGSDNIEAVWVTDEFNNEYVEELGIRKYDIQRIRRSAAVALDYKFNASNTVYFNAIYNWRDDRENRYAKVFDGMEPIYNGETITGFTGSVLRETKGGIDSERGKSTRLEEQRVQNYALRGEHLLSTKLDLDWSFNYSTAKEFKPNERYIEFEQEDLEFSQNLSDIRKPLILSNAEDLTESGLSALAQSNSLTEESELGGRVNFRFPFSVISEQKGRIRTGVRMRLKEKLRDNSFFSYEPLAGFDNLASIPTSFYGGEGFNPGSQYVPGNFVSGSYLGGLNLTDTNLFEGQSDPSEFLAENYEAKESIFAGYVRWDQDFNSKLSMIAGFRVENTNIDYTGNRVLDEEELETQINTTNSYTNILPSISFKYDVREDFILRAAFTTALARPDYYTLAPFVNNIASDTEIIAGNPELDATFAYNFDFMAEKYFKSVGLISGGVFYKKLNDFIYTFSDNQYSTEKFDADFPTQINPIPAGENWTFFQSRNGKSVDIYGFEVAYQRQFDFFSNKFLKGFGVYLNYTYTASEAEGISDEDGNERLNTTLPGTTPHMFNGSLFWEDKKFSARISTNFASDYLDELGEDQYQDTYYDKQFFLDANASYKITPQIRIFAEANNLTNQPLRYYQGQEYRTKQLEFYEARVNLGLKFDF